MPAHAPHIELVVRDLGVSFSPTLNSKTSVLALLAERADRLGQKDQPRLMSCYSNQHPSMNRKIPDHRIPWYSTVLITPLKVATTWGILRRDRGLYRRVSLTPHPKRPKRGFGCQRQIPDRLFPGGQAAIASYFSPTKDIISPHDSFISSHTFDIPKEPPLSSLAPLQVSLATRLSGPSSRLCKSGQLNSSTNRSDPISRHRRPTSTRLNLASEAARSLTLSGKSPYCRQSSYNSPLGVFGRLYVQLKLELSRQDTKIACPGQEARVGLSYNSRRVSRLGSGSCGVWR